MDNQPNQYLPLPKSLRERYTNDYIRRYRAQRTSRARAIDKQLREESKAWQERRKW